MDPKNKNRSKRVFYEKIKKRQKTMNKKRCWQIKKNIQTIWKNSPEINVLCLIVCMATFESYGSS